MEDAHDQNFVELAKIEDDVLAMLEPVQTRMYQVASSTDQRVTGQELKTVLEALFVPDCLGSSPGLHGVANDGLEVSFSKSC
jgi:hypothetical protein